MLLSLDQRTTRRRWWRWTPLPAVLAIAFLALPSSAAPQPATVRTAAAVPLPGDCKPTPNPPPTEYGFVARVTGGTLTGSGPLKVTGIDVSVCGVIRLVNARPGSNCHGAQGELIIPADGIVTNALDARLAIQGMPVIENVPTTVKATPMTSYLSCDDSSSGLKLDLNMKVAGSAGAFGLACDVPMSGTVHATVTGPLLTSPYQGNATMTGSVTLGRVANNDKYCPGRLPTRIDTIAALPDSGYQVNWPTKVSVYSP